MKTKRFVTKAQADKLAEYRGRYRPPFWDISVIDNSESRRKNELWISFGTRRDDKQILLVVIEADGYPRILEDNSPKLIQNITPNTTHHRRTA